MLRYPGNAGQRVLERGFDDEVVQVGNRVEGGDEGLAVRGVAAERQAARRRRQMEAARRHHVIRRQRPERASLQGKRRAEIQRRKAQPRRLRTRNFPEIRPQTPVEQVVGQHVQHRRQRMHRHRRAAQVADAVEQERQAQHMIEVGMGEEHMVDLQQLFEVERGEAAAGVDQYVVVNQQAGGVAPAADAAAAAQYGEFHRCFDRGYLLV